jgi:PilZ domain
MQHTQNLTDDIVDIADSRRDPRIIVSLAGRCMLATRLDASGRPREFACRVISISVKAMAVLAPMIGAVGEPVIVDCDEFGKLEGSIIRLSKRGFVMSIGVNDDERSKLADKIDWYEKYKNHDVTDAREQKRLIPKDPRSNLTLPDGSLRRCTIIDMSGSGVAVSADVKPEIGTPLAVGKIVGKVVRHFAAGFAVQFIEQQSLESLEQRLKKSRVVTSRPN